jgi:hypothetical protein
MWKCYPNLSQSVFLTKAANIGCVNALQFVISTTGTFEKSWPLGLFLTTSKHIPNSLIEKHVCEYELKEFMFQMKQ